jgi:hypothetical protein
VLGTGLSGVGHSTGLDGVVALRSQRRMAGQPGPVLVMETRNGGVPPHSGTDFTRLHTRVAAEREAAAVTTRATCRDQGRPTWG